MGKLEMNSIHDKQIPTTMKAIHNELDRVGIVVPRAICKCISCGSNRLEYKKHLTIAALLLERISCLVYRDKSRVYRKPPPETYKDALFEAFAEYPADIAGLLSESAVTQAEAAYVHKLLWKIADVVCPMMACVTEQGFVHEYAYAIDYVIRHDGDLPKPEMKTLFPSNYKNYRYWEGVADVIKDYLDL